MKNKIFIICGIVFLILSLAGYMAMSGRQSDPVLTTEKDAGDTIITLLNPAFRHVNFYLTTDDIDEDIKTSDSVCMLRKSGQWVELNQSIKRSPLYWLRNGLEYKIVGYDPQNGYIRFDCKDPVACHEANFFCWLDSSRYDSFLTTDYVFKRGKYLNRDSILAFAKEDFQQNCKYLERYAAQYPVSEQFKQNCRKWFALNELDAKSLAFRRALRLGDTLRWENVRVLLQQDSLLFRNDSLLFTALYKRMVNLYSNYLVVARTKQKKAALLDQYNVSRTFFQGKTRDYALFSLWRSMMALKDTCINQVDFLADCRDDSYRSLFLEKMAFAENVGQYAPGHFLTLDGKVFSWTDLLKKWERKTVYLDCWASWCEPCRKLLPASHALAAEYAGREVIFVYLSLDTDVVNWKKACGAEGLSQGESYCVLHPQDFKKKWGFVSLPHYILLDKKGKPFRNPCSRPNEPETKELLNLLSGGNGK